MGQKEKKISINAVGGGRSRCSLSPYGAQILTNTKKYIVFIEELI